MPRPKSDLLDPRRAPLRSHPAGKVSSDEGKEGSSSLSEPIEPTEANALLPLVHSEADNAHGSVPAIVLHPSQDYRESLLNHHQSLLQSILRAPSSGVSDIPAPAPVTEDIQDYFGAAVATVDSNGFDNNPRQTALVRPLSSSPEPFNEPESLAKIEASLCQHPSSMTNESKQAHLDRLREIPSYQHSTGQSAEEESGQCDGLNEEHMDRLNLFHSSLLAGISARNSRRGRSKMDHLPLTEDSLPEVKETSDLGTSTSLVTESKESTGLNTRTSDATEGKVSTTVTQISDDPSAPEVVSSITFHQETEESLDCLIDELVAEDGKDPDPEILSIGAGETSAYPPALFDTDVREGLSDEEVIARRKKHGWNRLKAQKQNYFIKFLSFFNGPVQWVMEVSNTIDQYDAIEMKHMLIKFSHLQVAIILAGGLQDWIDFSIIVALMLLNAIVGFGQEYHAGNIVESLKQTLALKALVIRNGSLVEINSEEVVLGDILLVEDGTIIAADGKLLCENAYIQVDQSGITGESLSVDKRKEDLIFSSSVVKRGKGFMVVTATGDHTYVGIAAALVMTAGNSAGHFSEVLKGMSGVLLVLVISTIFIVWIAGYYRSCPMVQMLEFTLAITVIGVPVGLPVVVTTTLAVGASNLANKQAIVQKLSAIESLAGVEILCTDKTGTLTRNKLTLGEPYVVPGITEDELMVTACLAANRNKGGIDAIDKVFLKGLRNRPWAKSQIVSYKTREFHPFDPVSKKVTAIVEAPDGETVICVKGAPMTVLRTVGKDTTLCSQFFKDYEAKVNEFASRGFRALGVARKRQGRPWEVLGIIPCLDPPRHDTAKTILEAQNLGLSIKMLTGDTAAIARETARGLGLGTNIYNIERLGVTGAGSMPGSEVNDFVEAADGFAEVYPQHKYSVVEILQRRGYLVAMTGDGVNDAASLKKADTGIAVEGASDAARSAADIVFLASGLSAIIDAIKISRQIFHRMYAYVVYRIALSLHLEIFLGLWVVVRNEILDLRLVVLFAIFAEIATLTIAYDNASYSPSPVKWNQPRLWGESILLGLILAGGSWITLGTMLLQGEDGGVIEGRGSRDAVLFLQISLTQSWLILITRITGSGSKSLWANRPSVYLVAAVVAVNLTATFMTAYGIFSHPTSWLTIWRVWILSFGVTCVNALVYILAHTSRKFDNLMHGKSPRSKDKERSWEDFGLNMQRMANQHENSA
ncbi:P-type ATPase [Penicillium paradoxum]|uniref:P-type ATPase n=1 Tax=Penicillium paradoxum TaxID=176176 RepID=UPI002548D1CB|nr:P-type ATPase [Penicillium paradoxum]KAJ5787070.1 P-type ATPase [Penicillium paradoxum]